MSILDILKPIHIAAGSLTLLSGLIAMASKKQYTVNNYRTQFYSEFIQILGQNL
jgi:hypothetical protein